MNKLFPKWFTIWFYISCAVLAFGGIIDEINEKPPESINAWGASISMLIMYAILQYIWTRRSPFQTFLEKFNFSYLQKAVFIGWLFAEIDEIYQFH